MSESSNPSVANTISIRIRRPEGNALSSQLSRCKLAKLLQQPASFFRATNDETRRRILVLLSEHGKMKLHDIAEKFAPKTHSIVGRHLVYLATAGLVIRERNKRNVEYEIVSNEHTNLVLAILSDSGPNTNEQFFSAISDDTRRAVLTSLLAGESRNVTQYAGDFSISKTAMGRHLALLRDAGLAVETKLGTSLYFSFPGTDKANIQ